MLKEFAPIHGSINIDMDMSMILAVKLKARLQISLSLLSTQRYFRVLSQVIHRKLKMLNFKGNDWLNLYKGFLEKSQLKEQIILTSTIGSHTKYFAPYGLHVWKIQNFSILNLRQEPCKFIC